MKNIYSKLIYSLMTCLMALFTTGANAQTWNFSSLSAEDKALLDADADWILGTNRYCYIKELSNAALVANGTELTYAKGLRFTAVAPTEAVEGKAKIRLNYGSSRLELNGSNVVLTIPGLTAGQKVTVVCITASSSAARGFNVTNLEPVSGYFNSTSTSEQTNVATVIADGDVTLTTTAGMYVSSIKVEDEGSSEPDPATYNSVPLNTAKNQMRLTLKSNDIKYYNTEDVSVAIDKAAGTVTVNPISGTWSDVYTKTVSDISFAKAEETGSEGDINNEAGHVKITEAKGWQESAYVKWEPFTGATSYNVYIKGGNYADYTKIDEQLVRNYGSYARADVVGLVAASNYSLMVVPVNESGEIANTSSEAQNIAVVNYDRSGFAHKDWNKGVGAYNNDGSLKQGAKVLYITKNNFNTVSLEMITTSKGGKETRVGIGDIFNAKQKGYDTTPIAVRIIGTITANDADAAQRQSDQGSLLLKGNNTSVDMGVTVEGIGDDACLNGFGLGFVDGCDIEARNLAFMNHPSSNDCIEVKGSNHIWIHNCDFFYAVKGSGDHVKGDGSTDCKDGCSYATFSYNHYFDTGKSILCGMKGEEVENMITYHHNWFDHSDSRHPRVRTSTVHVYNNYYDGVSKYGVGATMGASIFVEGNYFRDTNKPMMISLQGTDAIGDGTFSSEAGGMIKSYGNIFAEKSSNFSYITHKDNATSFDAYEASSRDEVVPDTYKSLNISTAKNAEGTYNNFDTSSSMYSYTADAAADVPAIVTGYWGAGRLNHGDLHYTFDNNADDHDYGLNAGLASLVSGYKTSLLGIFGDENASSGEGGSTGGGTGGETGGGDVVTPIEGTITCSFEGKQPSNNAFTISGNYSTDKGSVTVDGVTYNTCLKMETATSITFTTAKKMEMTLYFGTSDTKCDIKIDDVRTDGDMATHTLTATLEAGTHTLKKQSSCNLFYIKLVPVTE